MPEVFLKSLYDSGTQSIKPIHYYPQTLGRLNDVTECHARYPVEQRKL